MNDRLTELALRVCSEPDPYLRLVLIEELKEIVDEEAERLKAQCSKPSHWPRNI